MFSPRFFLAILLSLQLICITGIFAGDQIDEGVPAHGMVGLRPLPRDRAEAIAVAGIERGPGIPLFDSSLGDSYPVTSQGIDALYGGFEGDTFKTKKIFFEHYWGLSTDRDDLRPEKNALAKEIHAWENQGREVAHILICREFLLMKDQGYPDAVPGPFQEDTRILSLEDVRSIRKMFAEGYASGFLKNQDYKLIQMVEHPSFFAEEEKVHPILEAMDGVAYEVHQFNRHWPLDSGWSKPELVVKGAKWTLLQGKEYIFYYGPIIWKSPEYYPYVERDWLETFWKAGLPKSDPKMHYYLNLFPHAHGCGRPVGPESDPQSVLGFTKWVIQEIK